MTTATKPRYNSYASLNDTMQGRRHASMKLDNNTFAIRNADGTIAVRLHNTDIVTFHNLGQITLNAGGWFTDVTMQRITASLPAGVSIGTFREEKGQVSGRWYLFAYQRGTYEAVSRFYEGISFGFTDGKLELVSDDPGTDAWDAEDYQTEQKIQRYLKAYTGGYDAKNCSSCGCFAEEEREVERLHLQGHLDKQEYLYSLFYAAYTAMGYRNPGYVMDSDIDSGRLNKKHVRKYLRKRLYLGATQVR